MIQHTTDTIAAIATPPGAGGVGIIRISGPDAAAIACGLFCKKGREEHPDPADMKSHHMYYGHVVDPGSRERIDEALLVVMQAPRSYTGEEVAEIQAHGGPYLLRTILSLVVAAGARLADPGEFTRRAFLNGRMDLTQAEAVMDLIEARTAAGQKMASALMQGALGEEVAALREQLLDLEMRIAAEIDFPEDVGDVADPGVVVSLIKDAILPVLDGLILRHADGHRIRDGVRLAIAGIPNVGKSSLMNRLLEKDRSIVTDLPGTTRDLVEESLNLSGIPFVVTDTAGIRQTDNPVESIGVARAKERIAQADLVLLMVDAARDLDEETLAIAGSLTGRSHIVVVNKTDMAPSLSPDDFPAWCRPDALIGISARTGEGMDALRKAIRDVALPRIPVHAAIPNLRQDAALKAARAALLQVVEGLENGMFWDLVSVDLAESVRALGLVIGDTADPDLLDRIFSEFCIGK